MARLYLDFGEDFERVQPVLQRWYDETVDLLLPSLGDGMRPPKRGRAVNEGAAARPVSAWRDALTPDVCQISWTWSNRRRRSSLDLYVFRFAAPDHLMLEASVSFEDQPGRLAEIAPRLQEMLRRVASSTDPAYGEVALDGGAVTGETLLDMGLYRINSDSAAESRRFLRGYDWVTVVPRELAERLGGVAPLAASGAFAEVVPLPEGGVLLRAGEAEDPYRPETVHAVFRALAPVLPAGQPRRLPGYDLSRLVFADPAQLEPTDPAPAPVEAPIHTAQAQIISDFAVEAVKKGWLTSEPLPPDHPGAAAGLLDGHARVGLTEERRQRAEELASRLAQDSDPAP
ncbi:hypothetical protein E1211_11265 [Micromonospora sp. 15K316]|uniref:hypothetical protein n=1 Tax=Micromonospora sp. 15K316 TaxID=2530376 RepID=UPI00104C40D6|nr:hypothetical protein [Micromonospora sp. 15K316]TDC37176.1 hypothetical protein E1211_11265 [Micromonospora sp. 15K316]